MTMGLVCIAPQGLAEACGPRWTIKYLLLKKKWWYTYRRFLAFRSNMSINKFTSIKKDLWDGIDSNTTPNFVASWGSHNNTGKTSALQLGTRFNPVSNSTQKLDIGFFINVGWRGRKVIKGFCPIWPQKQMRGRKKTIDVYRHTWKTWSSVRNAIKWVWNSKAMPTQ